MVQRAQRESASHPPPGPAFPVLLNVARRDGALPWVVDGIDALSRRLAATAPGWSIVIEHTGVGTLMLADTHDWRILRTGRALLSFQWDTTEGPSGDSSAAPWVLMPFHKAAFSHFPSLVTPLVSSIDDAEVGSPLFLAGGPFPPTLRPVPELYRRSIPAAAMAAAGQRRILNLGSGSVTRRQARLMDESGKTRAVVHELKLTRRHGAEVPWPGPRRIAAGSNPARADTTFYPPDAVFVLAMQPLRGYGRSLPSVFRVDPPGAPAVVRVLAADAGRAPLDYDTRLHRRDTPPVSVPDLHAGIVWLLCRTMAANHDGMWARLDPEFLHDYRVALRRLRSYLQATKLSAHIPAVWRGWIAEVWYLSGEARDLDVFLMSREAYRRNVPAALHEETDRLFDLLVQDRDAAYRALEHSIGSGGEERLARALVAAFAGRGLVGSGPTDRWADARTFARWAVRRRRRAYRRAVVALHEAYRREREHLSDEMIHEARKTAKRYRYVLEVFSSVPHVATSKDRSMKRLKRLQDLLGEYNDLVVQSARLHALLQTVQDSRVTDLRGAVGYLAAHVEREKAVARRNVMEELGREVDTAQG